MALIAPSILAADFAELGQAIERVEKAGADWIHCDIMDGHFVPNISFGPGIVATARKATTLPLDVHLMIEQPERYIETFRRAGADRITVHAEVCTHLHRTIGQIHETGAEAGVAVNPATSLATIYEILPDLDLLLIMTVNPGFGGQSFIARSPQKIRHAKEMIASSGREIFLEVDGGIDRETTPAAVRAGANVLVAGSAIFGAEDPAAACRDLRQRANAPLRC